MENVFHDDIEPSRSVGGNAKGQTSVAVGMDTQDVVIVESGGGETTATCNRDLAGAMS
jgi:hypothetical protein